MDWPFILSFLVALLAILNPLGNLTLFIGQTSCYTPGVRRAMAILLSGAILALLIFTLFAGEFILKIFDISIPAFRLAGGLVVLIVGLSMIKGSGAGIAKKSAEPEEEAGEDDFKEAEARLSDILIPLGVPIFVGPGTMSTVILYADKAHNLVDFAIMPGVIFIAVAITCGVLLLSDRIMGLLGKTGLEIATRIFGLILVAIAMQFFLDGLAQATVGIFNPLYAHG